MTDEHWLDMVNKLLTHDAPRRGVLGALALTLGHRLGATDAAAKKGGKGNGKKNRKRSGKQIGSGTGDGAGTGDGDEPTLPPPQQPCLAQVGECRAFFAGTCASSPAPSECEARNSPCCEFLGSCDAAGLFSCLVEASQTP